MPIANPKASQRGIDVDSVRVEPIFTPIEWPHCERNKKQTWRKEAMNQRKSILGSYSHLQPSSEVKRKAIAKMR